MARSPHTPFNNSANDREPDASKENVSLRDKDNADLTPKAPSFANLSRSNQAPRGAVGHRGDLQIQFDHSDSQTSNPNVDVSAWNWVRGNIGDGEYQFAMRQSELPSTQNLNDKTISDLVITKDNVTVAHFERGWKIEPQFDADREATRKLIDQFDPPEKEFKTITDRDPENGQTHER